jgi:CubicO group peptidase (beta-lactamase class C family)
VTGDDIGVMTKHWLTGPLGMSDTSWRQRPWVAPGMDASSIGLCTTARDLARLGELMLAGGVWRGRRIVSRGYVEAAVTPSQSLNMAYGLLWWLNGRSLRTGPGMSDRALADAAPSDMYAAQGALGRKVYVVPSLALVVVRLGDAPDDDFNQRFWELLTAAARAEPAR